MLILTRKIGESVLVGQDIEIAVLGIKGKQIKIGIRAPPEVGISRIASEHTPLNSNLSAADPGYSS